MLLLFWLIHPYVIHSNSYVIHLHQLKAHPSYLNWECISIIYQDVRDTNLLVMHADILAFFQ